MELLIALFSVILAVSGMPTEMHGDAFNGTRQIGFASFGGGTHGGQGGPVWTVWDAWALRDACNGNDRRIVSVRGRIDVITLFTGSPGVNIQVGSFKTVTGGDSNAMITGGGLSINGRQQVIIENLKIHNSLSFAPGEQPNGAGGIISMMPGAWSTIDNVGVLGGSTNVWINHCEMADDPWLSHTIPEDRRRHDGLVDITGGANWVTVSNSIFRNHNLVMLVGNSDALTSDRGRLKTTYYGNWFMGTTQRNPRVRYGEVHIYNNLYTDIQSYGAGVGAGALIYLERNAFVNCRRAWGFASGVPNPAGFLLAIDNLVANSGFDAGIPSNGVTWRPSQYYSYNAIPATQVEWSVRANAGTR